MGRGGSGGRVLMSAGWGAGADLLQDQDVSAVLFEPDRVSLHVSQDPVEIVLVHAQELAAVLPRHNRRSPFNEISCCYITVASLFSLSLFLVVAENIKRRRRRLRETSFQARPGPSWLLLMKFSPFIASPSSSSSSFQIGGRYKKSIDHHKKKVKKKGGDGAEDLWWCPSSH